jgi:4-aminobutyrate aminotransferase-like enzyme
MSSAAAVASSPRASRVPLTTEENLALRRRHLAPSQKIHYDGVEGGPLHLSRGEGAYLYDINNVRHLDCVNNVAHVGHCHPRVVAAASAQLGTLNTNSRYVHDNISRLAEALAATFPGPLSSVFFVNSGTEANDLAMRLLRNHTKRQTIYCVDGAYHGHSIATLSISPYSKYAVAESSPGAVKLMQPDVYRLGLTEAETTQMALDQYREMLDSR